MKIDQSLSRHLVFAKWISTILQELVSFTKTTAKLNWHCIRYFRSYYRFASNHWGSWVPIAEKNPSFLWSLCCYWQISPTSLTSGSFCTVKKLHFAMLIYFFSVTKKRYQFKANYYGYMYFPVILNMHLTKIKFLSLRFFFFSLSQQSQRHFILFYKWLNSCTSLHVL